MTPKGSALARLSPPTLKREDEAVRERGRANRGGVEHILIEERAGAVYFARIPDLGRFMADRGLQVHEDVLRTLSDLVLSLVGEEGNDGSGSRG
jgi:hypothetical protein